MPIRILIIRLVHYLPHLSSQEKAAIREQKRQEDLRLEREKQRRLKQKQEEMAAMSEKLARDRARQDFLRKQELKRKANEEKQYKELLSRYHLDEEKKSKGMRLFNQLTRWLLTHLLKVTGCSVRWETN
jgi:hypothetical protein